MQEVKKNGLSIKPIKTMMNHATTEVFFDNLKIPEDNLVGDEIKGFRYIYCRNECRKNFNCCRMYR